jgi:glycosyltransferase involved in cell wall biosynthesis
VGRLVGWKRVDMLIRAVARLRAEFPDIELIVAGYGPEEEGLKILADEEGVRDRVRFLGGVYDPSHLGRYFLASSVYVLAGMGGLSINDAMCFGLPVICSVCDGTEKMLVREGYSGRYFKEGDQDDLTDKIAWMFRHPDERRKMGENATAVIRDEMNIHTVVKGYADAFAYVSRGA